MSAGENTIELANNELTVLAIAGCPYCYESIDDLKLISERVGKGNIKFVVFTGDSTNIAWYKDKALGKIKVVQADESSPLFGLAKGRFPTFVFKGGDEIRVWNNSGFGVRAKDWIEGQI